MTRHKDLVIGFGNPLRRDDGAGAAVAACLPTRLPDAQVLSVPQLVPEIADAVARAGVVVFVDAEVGRTPGELRSRRVWPSRAQSLGHALTPEALMGLCQALYDRCPPAFLVSIGADDFGVGPGLSEAVSAAVPTAVGTIADVLSASRNRTGRQT